MRLLAGPTVFAVFVAISPAPLHAQSLWAAHARVIAQRDLIPRTAIGYREGRPFRLQIVRVSWSKTVEVRTAEAFVRMYRAAARDGVKIWIYSGFRTYERQRELYQAYRRGKGNKASRPGYSNHQTGSAVDFYLGVPGALEWLLINGWRFGFFPTVLGEPWHYEYFGRLELQAAQIQRPTLIPAGVALRPVTLLDQVAH